MNCMYLNIIFLWHYLINITVINSSMLPKKPRNKYNIMKNKLTDLLNVNKDVGLYFDINEFEYPGANDTLRNIHKEMWHEYYNCLMKQYFKAGVQKTSGSLSLTAMEGTSATLQCNICISPNEIHTIESVKWFHDNLHDGQFNVSIDPEDHLIISPDNRALIIYNVQKNQEGLYWCRMEATISTPYYLNVITETEPIIIVRPDEAPNAKHSIPPIILERYGLKIYSSWSSWSPCSTCETVGQRVRYGYCTISLINIPDYTVTAASDILQWEQLANRILPIFQNQLPCRSWYTPRIIQEIPEVKNRATEIMKSFCKIKCQRNEIFEIRDKNGKVLESANNSAGIYSMVQGIPDPQPSVVRRTQYGIHDTKAIIKCPGNLNTDVPIEWHIDTKILNPEIINQQSQGRISVDYYQRIVFKTLRYVDENIYSCWQRDELVGTVRLKVVYEMASEITKLDHRVLMLTSFPVVSIMLWVYWRAFQGRNRFVKR